MVVDRDAFRLAAILVASGLLLFLVALYAHNMIDGEVGNGNNHVAEFTAIAAGGNWTAIHVVQFLATAIITAGLLTLYSALNITAGMPAIVNRFAAAANVVALALAGAVYAVDGVALKQAADAWARALVAQKPVLFASAEGIRWLKWGTRSYQSIMSGLTLVLFAAVKVWTARLPRAFGVVIGVAGLASLQLGWQTGVDGFAPYIGPTFDFTGLLLLVVNIWLLILAWRMPAPSRT
jgi:hypothetical protein